MLNSWGNYPKIHSNQLLFHKKLLYKYMEKDNFTFIPYGNGRSYGDSCLNDNILYCKPANRIIDFDTENGILHAECGVMLSEILDVVIPKGYFLQITPGTKFITLGGAIASNVHGKNHHKNGNFISCVLSFKLMLPNGEIINCSQEENSDFFFYTFGGMGLTGVILDAVIKLKPIKSKNINQITIKTNSLKETFEAFESYKDYPYSVAWIDVLAKDKNLGRCILTVGDFATDGDLINKKQHNLTVPFMFPSFTLNSFTVNSFNKLYYMKAKNGNSIVDYNTFFYPLDSINDWNKIYGKNGFTQYQCIFPKDTSFQGLTEVLNYINKSGNGSFLAVLKLYGKEDNTPLCFPMEGYSLALDFKITKNIFKFLDLLDEIVIKYGGRIYLTKDCRVNKVNFDNMYVSSNDFRNFRQEHKLNMKLHSLQSLRLEL